MNKLTKEALEKLSVGDKEGGIRSTNPSLDLKNPLTKSMIEYLVQRGRDAKTKP